MAARDSQSSVDDEPVPFGTVDDSSTRSTKKSSAKARSVKKTAAKKTSAKKRSSKKPATTAKSESDYGESKPASKRKTAKKTTKKAAKKTTKRASATASKASTKSESPEPESTPAKSRAPRSESKRSPAPESADTNERSSEHRNGAAESADADAGERGTRGRRSRRGRRRRGTESSEGGSTSPQRSDSAAGARVNGSESGDEASGRRRRGRRERLESRGNFRPDAPKPDDSRSQAALKSRRRPGRGQNPNGQGPKSAGATGTGKKGARGSGKYADRQSPDKHRSGRQGGSHKDGGARGKERIGGECEGLLVTDKGGHGKLRQRVNQFLPDKKEDVHLSPRLIQKFSLRDGAMVRGRFGKGMGKHKYDLIEVLEVDGEPPAEARKLPPFKKLVSIDPDFHYALGDLMDDTSMRVVDLICPIGRGQRGLIVAPPRSGKTVLLQKIAKGIEEHYSDVKLLVLLIDERPEEATEWRRTIQGDVFCSTNDEMPKTHVELAESIWRHAMRLVERGEDVVLLLDSITRLARAYNHVHGNSGKTMSGGLDTRAMERPKQFFGSARNTETAGSLTILGTTLIETGSQMDKVIFEEFKGTGNMELVLSRKLADRRIFPAIDIERSGTRKEEKLLSAQRLHRITTLRRVLSRMNFIEAMELLITKLDDVERNDDFLKRFDIDPEA